MIYGAPLDSVALFCVDFDYRNGTIATRVNTMKTYYDSVWQNSSAINPVILTSKWLDVITSNGPSPVADFTYLEGEVCLGGQITVNGSSSQNTTNCYWYVTDDPFTTILFQNSTAGNNFTFNQVANRRIYLFADGSCQTDGLYLPVIVNAIPTAVVKATNITCGINNGSIVFSSPAEGDTPSYTYSLDGVNYQASPILNNLATGTYIVHIKTPGDNCDRTYTRVIDPSSELTAGINPSVTICEGGSATLTATGGSSNTWYDGTTQIGTTASINVTPAATNQFTFVVNDGTCTSSVYTYVNVEICNGIEALAREVKIYPNPATNEFMIELDGTFKFKLYDARGRIVLDGSGKDKVEIQTTDVEAGIYLVEISNDSFIHSYRIIKK